eukprot:g14789.t1
MVGNILFAAGGMALVSSAGAAYVEYATYQNNDCVNVISTSVYAGVPTIEGVQATDTCLEYAESTTTSLLLTSQTDGAGVVALQHVCNMTTTADSAADIETANATEAGRLTNVWYSTADCEEGTVSYEYAQNVCDARCTVDEPDFGSDEFEDATITFYDSADCSNSNDTETYTMAELYEFYGVEDGTSCSPSGDFDFNTVIQCSGDSPVAVYYEDNTCTGDAVGMTYYASCAPVPSNGTFPGNWFMAECTEGTAAVEDDDEVAEEEDEEEVEDAGNGAASSVALGLSSGVAAAVIAAVFAGLL